MFKISAKTYFSHLFSEVSHVAQEQSGQLYQKHDYIDSDGDVLVMGGQGCELEQNSQSHHELKINVQCHM